MRMRLSSWQDTLRKLGFRRIWKIPRISHVQTPSTTHTHFQLEQLESRTMLAGGTGTISFAVSNVHLLNDTGPSSVDLVTSDARVTGSVTGTQPTSGTARVQFDHYGNGTVESVQTVTVGSNFTYDP